MAKKGVFMKKSNGNRRKREPFFRRNKRPIRGFAAAFLVLLSGYSAWGLYDELTRNPNLEIAEIKLKGALRVTGEEVLELTGLRAGQNILTIGTLEAEKSLKTHPYIEGARVKRILPSTISIEIEEREPVLIVSLDGLYLMDGKGVLFKKYSREDALDLPVVTGLEDFKEDSEAAFESGLFPLVKALKEGGGFGIENVSEIHVDPTYGFTVVTLDGGARIEFGKDGFEDKLKSLQRIMVARGGTLRGIESVDLGNVRGVIVRSLTGSKKEGGVS